MQSVTQRVTKILDEFHELMLERDRKIADLEEQLAEVKEDNDAYKFEADTHHSRKLIEAEKQLADAKEYQEAYRESAMSGTAEITEHFKKREEVLREALEESQEVVIYVQNNTEHIEGCPNVPITCMRCAVDDLRKHNRAALDGGK